VIHARCLSVVVLSIAVTACSSSPVAVGTPPATITGAWSTWPPGAPTNPAGPFGLTLSQAGDSVTGTGGWAASTYLVAGNYARPLVTLVLTSNQVGSVGSTRTLRGRAVSATVMILGSDSTRFYKH
jgi:hypothetical protein